MENTSEERVEAPVVSTTNNIEPQKSPEARLTWLARARGVAESAAAKPFWWAAAVIVSTFLGAAVNAWWTAPRAFIAVTAVQLRTSGDVDGAVPISVDIRGRVSDHIYLEDLEDKVTEKDLREFIAATREKNDKFQSVAIKVDRLLDLLRTRPATLDVNDRRREFLLSWYAGGHGKVLESFVKATLGSQLTLLPAIYRVPRKEPYTHAVELKTGSIISMEEIDAEEAAKSESAVRGRVNVYDRVLMDARDTNLLRRTWEYMEPAVLVPALESVKERLLAEVSAASDISANLDAAIRAARPDYIYATSVITNNGGRPLAIRNSGVLFLSLPGQNGSSARLIPVDMRDPRHAVTVIEPGKVEVVELASIKTAEQLIREYAELRQTEERTTDQRVDPLQGSRLKLLFEGGGMTAALRLPRAGAATVDAALPISDYASVGVKGDEAIFTALRVGEKNIVQANILAK